MLAKKTAFYSHAFLAIISISIIGLLYSKAILSISVVLLGILAITNAIERKKVDLPKWEFLALFFIFTLYILDIFRHGDSAIVEHKILLKGQLLFLPFAMFQLRHYLAKNIKKIIAILTILVILTNLFSLSNYFMNRAHFDALLLQSKHIPIIGGLHHIYFGILNGLCIITLLVYSAENKRLRQLKILSISILVLSMHVLSSRTGLLMLYSGFFFWLLWLSYTSRKFKALMIGLSILLIFPVLSYFISSSFKNKVHNSLEDIEHWQNGKDINFKSMAMRLEAYKVTWQGIKSKPLIGYGSGNYQAQLQKQYELSDSILFKENRIGPHNQFLETWFCHGLFGLAFLLAWIILVFWNGRGTHVGLVFSMLLLTFLLESVLERQAGIFITVFFTYLVRFWNHETSQLD